MKIIDGKYIYKTKPTVCKKCGSRKIATLLYGHPHFTPELDQEISDKEVIIMGCCIYVEDFIQNWQCAECDEAFYTEFT